MSVNNINLKFGRRSMPLIVALHRCGLFLMPVTKINAYCLIAFLTGTLFCGCFQARNAFYSESEIQTDKRLEGSFEPEALLREQLGEQSLVLELQSNKHYLATYRQGGRWIKLDAVLFRSGTNFFVDISHRADNGTLHEPATGPSLLDMLQLATREKTHSVLRVRFSDGGTTFEYAYGNPVLMAIRKDPTLKFRAEENQIILLDSTDKLRLFLNRVGIDDDAFSENVRFSRSSK